MSEIDLTKMDKNEICHIKCHQRKAYQKEIKQLEHQLKEADIAIEFAVTESSMHECDKDVLRKYLEKYKCDK